jgi:hypothetical protein
VTPWRSIELLLNVELYSIVNEWGSIGCRDKVASFDKSVEAIFSRALSSKGVEFYLKL